MINITPRATQSGEYLTIDAINRYGKTMGSETFFRLVRQKRNYMLEQSDWAVNPDSPLSESKKQEWIIFRQFLRDIPQNIQNLHIKEWPQYP